MAGDGDAQKLHDWNAPTVLAEDSGQCMAGFTLHGLRDVDPDEPVCHLSFYEAAAYASWADARLPTEFEWEAASNQVPFDGRFLDLSDLQPRAAAAAAPGELMQMYGDVWECWTRSSYDPYPGFKPASPFGRGR